ncbi:MAG: glycosyltransferase [Desulfuromonadaceae bacterium]|nr:glycosyltransferase [Desulfuromonadaceae bacterium]MDD5104173.1 glycosyltransferase [Desulfuromonadaceae bacterium]
MKNANHVVCGGASRSVVSIVVVTYNSASTIYNCLLSLLGTLEQGDEVAVIDNHSSDDTLAIIHSLKPQFCNFNLTIIENRDNVGFSIATNQGIFVTSAPYVILLNPDTIVTTGWLENMLLHFSDDSTAAVGPLSNFAAGRQSVACHWNGALPESISPDDAVSILCAHNISRSEYTKLLIGFCFAVRRDVLKLFGNLDERLILGNDDLELSWRLRVHGFNLKIATDVFVYHEGQHSFASEPTGATSVKVQQSTDALYRILQEHYGIDRVPTPVELWGIDWFTPSTPVFNTHVAINQVLTLPIPAKKPTADTHPLVSIIILTFNQRAHTESCLRSIADCTPEPHEVILVDNCSTDGTRQWLTDVASTYKHYRIILNNDNRGFSAGCNQGLSVAKGEFLVLLNNDVIVTPDWLNGLLECHHSEPHAGITGPLTNNSSGIQGLGPQLYSSIDSLNSFALNYRTQNRYRRIRSRRLVGFCMFFHRSLYELIGGLDERYGTGNFEDDDFCLRSAIAGFSNVVAGDVFIHHHGSASFAAAGIDYSSMIFSNNQIFHEKWSNSVNDRTQAEQIALCRIREDVELLLLEEKAEKAISLIRDAASRHPGNRVIQILLCHAYCATGNYSGALDLSAFSPPLQKTLQAYLLNAVGKFDAAEQILKSAIALDRGFGSAYIELGHCLIRKGEIEYGSAYIIKGILLDPTSSRIGYLLPLLNRPNSSPILAAILSESLHLNPRSRRIARLLVEQLSFQQDLNVTLNSAEQFIANFAIDEKVVAHGLGARRMAGPWKSCAPSGKSVTLCMIVKNEERYLAQCILSCRPLVHEIIVVDTGSDDATAQIAEILGAKVYPYVWDNDFGKARNYSLSLATGDWILVLDADEKISTRDYETFYAILNESRCTEAFSMVTRNYTKNNALDGFNPLDNSYPETHAGSGWTSSSKIRLFPNHPGIFFEGMVHETVEDSVRISGFSIHHHPTPVHHYGCLDTERALRKQEVYYILGKEKATTGADVNSAKALYELAVQAAELKRYSESEELWHEFLVIEPEHAVAWFNLGYTYLKMKRVRDALAVTEKALSFQRDYPAAVANYALCCFILFPIEHSTQIIQKARHMLPFHHGTKILELLAYCLTGQLGKSIEGIRRLVTEGYDVSVYLEETATLLDSVNRSGESQIIKALADLMA